MKVAIIGAGISGLSVAHFLKDRHEVTVFEKESAPGGLIKCRRIDGSLFHTCGGHVFNSKRKDVLDWFWSQFVREKEFSKAERNSVVLMSDGTTIPYPIENHMYLFDKDIQKKFIEDLVIMAQNQNVEPTNFEDFLKARFGNTLYEMYFRPYNEKVWRRELKHVPISWLEGKLPMPTIAEMIYNNINHVKEKEFVHSTFWYENNDGSQYIANKLSEGLHIVYNTEIEEIKVLKSSGVEILGELFDIVVFCGNIKDFVTMLYGVDVSKFKDEIEKLKYHGTTAVFCEIDKNPYSWIYQPDKKHESHRIICTGNFAETNNSTKLQENRITATIEFTDYLPYPDIIDNLSRIPFHPTYLDHQYNQCTYPIQDSNTRNMIQSLKSYMASYGLYFTGRFADWEYYNMDVAIGAAMDLCRAI